MAEKLRVGALASGGGTNLQAIIDRCGEGSLKAEVVLVISNNRESGALERARQAGIQALFIDHRDFDSREAFDRAAVKALRAAGVELVVLAGFMRILSEVFVEAFPNRIMNIHPALLPAFPGLHVQRKALEYGVRFAGCTVHFVDIGTDTGPIIIQAVVPVLDNDTEASLSARILEQEHQIYPRAIQLFAEGKLHVEGRRVFVGNGTRQIPALINP